jgi:DNA ligase (NAD+)
MSDYEYDELFDELKKLESETNFKLANSPTMTVGFDVVDKLNKVKHNHPMLSLDKTKSVDEMQKFIGNKPILTMLKMDGLTISVKYSEGKLVSAETRGNGVEGEDVTHNALVFTNLPQTISYRGDLVVDGEAIITYEDFEKINANLPEGEKYKNPRNLVSGSVRQLDSGIAAQRHIQFVAWKLVGGYENNSFSERLNWLETLGFTVVPRLDRFDERSINFLKIIADKYSYPIDGLVASFDDVDYLESLGATSHHLRGQLAFKFYDETATTILRDIEWNTSRSGLVNPIAIFDEVDISGSTISKATLHNLSYIKSLELGIGDEIEIYKANDIIPKVANNLTRTNSYKRPLLCKSCGAELDVHNDNGSETLHCPNEECPARMLDKFVHFVSKDGMDIQGLSEATLEKFISKRWITKFSDIYRLIQYKNEIIALDGFGQKSWDRLWQSIQDSRNTTMAKFICALGIPLVGKNTAKEVAKHSKIVDGKLDVDMSDSSVFTPSIINSIGKYLSIKTNLMETFALIYELNISNGIQPINDKLKNIKFCITGSFSISRDKIREILESYGAKFVSSVSSKTDILFCGENSGSKLTKAQQLGIKVIYQDELSKMINL